MDEKVEWKKLKNNMVLNGLNFYISYNANTENKHDQLGYDITYIANEIAKEIGQEINFKDGEETALFDSENNEWYILEGDFRAEYEEAFPKGFAACLNVYRKYKKTNRSKWSTDEI